MELLIFYTAFTECVHKIFSFTGHLGNVSNNNRNLSHVSVCKLEYYHLNLVQLTCRSKTILSASSSEDLEITFLCIFVVVVIVVTVFHELWCSTCLITDVMQQQATLVLTTDDHLSSRPGMGYT